MEFSEAARTNAIKFLRQFAGTSLEGDGAPPLRTNWPTFSESELEGECLDMGRVFLAKAGCPGILSYHISAAAYRRLQSEVDRYRVSDTGGENGDTPATLLAEVHVMAGAVGTVELDSELVAKGLLDAIRRVCEEWAESLPVLTTPGPDAKCDLSLYAMKNTRRKMEDKHALCVDVNSLFGLKGCPSQSFYAVFDGHIGVEAAAYASVHLLPNIVRHPLFLTDTETAIKEAFLTTDERFCEKQIRAGTTAVVVFVRGQTLYVGWLGDSQAFLVRKDKPVSLVEPHKPDREDERERIEAAGGMVVWIGVWRVNGNLSVSRAIGDVNDKKYVIGEPDVRTVEMDGSEDYLVLACDGVWDVTNGEELVECVRQHLAGGGSRQTTAKAIIDFAKSEGSGDNMTCIVVFPHFENGDQEKLKEGPPSTTHSSS